MTTSRIEKLCLKAISMTLCAAMVSTSCELAQAAAPAPLVQRPMLTLPANLGTIVDSNLVTKSSPLVILIQDLHVYQPVQRKIRDLLEFLLKQPTLKDTRVVGVEGAEGPIPTLAEAARPDPALKRKVADYLIEQGELTGAEAYAIEQGKGDLLWGVENNKYYEADRNLYLMTLQARKDLKQRLEYLDARLSEVSDKLEEPLAVQEVSKLGTALQEGEAEPVAVLGEWLKQGADMLINVGPYPRLRSLSQMIAGGTGRVRLTETQRMDVLQELQTFAPEFKAYLSTDKRSQNAFLAKKSIRFLINYLSQQASDYDVLAWTRHTNEMIARVKALGLLTDPEMAELTHRISNQIDFYSLALVRNEPMVHNLLARMGLGSVNRAPLTVNRSQLTQSIPPSTAILIAGGFHTRGITDLLRKQGVSYIVICPNVEGTPTAKYYALYEERLADHHLPTEELEAGVDQALGIPSAMGIPIMLKGHVETVRAAFRRTPLTPAQRIARREAEKKKISAYWGLNRRVMGIIAAATTAVLMGAYLLAPGLSGALTATHSTPTIGSNLGSIGVIVFSFLVLSFFGTVLFTRAPLRFQKNWYTLSPTEKATDIFGSLVLGILGFGGLLALHVNAWVSFLVALAAAVRIHNNMTYYYKPAAGKPESKRGLMGFILALPLLGLLFSAQPGRTQAVPPPIPDRPVMTMNQDGSVIPNLDAVHPPSQEQTKPFPNPLSSSQHEQALSGQDLDSKVKSTLHALDKSQNPEDFMANLTTLQGLLTNKNAYLISHDLRLPIARVLVMIAKAVSPEKPITLAIDLLNQLLANGFLRHWSVTEIMDAGEIFSALAENLLQHAAANFELSLETRAHALDLLPFLVLDDWITKVDLPQIRYQLAVILESDKTPIPLKTKTAEVLDLLSNDPSDAAIAHYPPMSKDHVKQVTSWKKWYLENDLLGALDGREFREPHRLAADRFAYVSPLYNNPKTVKLLLKKLRNYHHDSASAHIAATIAAEFPRDKLVLFLQAIANLRRQPDADTYWLSAFENILMAGPGGESLIESAPSPTKPPTKLPPDVKTVKSGIQPAPTSTPVAKVQTLTYHPDTDQYEVQIHRPRPAVWHPGAMVALGIDAQADHQSPHSKVKETPREILTRLLAEYDKAQWMVQGAESQEERLNTQGRGPAWNSFDQAAAAIRDYIKTPAGLKALRVIASDPNGPPYMRKLAKDFLDSLGKKKMPAAPTKEKPAYPIKTYDQAGDAANLLKFLVLWADQKEDAVVQKAMAVPAFRDFMENMQLDSVRDTQETTVEYKGKELLYWGGTANKKFRAASGKGYGVSLKDVQGHGSGLEAGTLSIDMPGVSFIFKGTYNEKTTLFDFDVTVIEQKLAPSAQPNNIQQRMLLQSAQAGNGPHVGTPIAEVMQREYPNAPLADRIKNIFRSSRVQNASAEQPSQPFLTWRGVLGTAVTLPFFSATAGALTGLSTSVATVNTTIPKPDAFSIKVFVGSFVFMLITVFLQRWLNATERRALVVEVLQRTALGIMLLDLATTVGRVVFAPGIPFATAPTIFFSILALAGLAMFFDAGRLGIKYRNKAHADQPDQKKPIGNRTFYLMFLGGLVIVIGVGTMLVLSAAGIVTGAMAISGSMLSVTIGIGIAAIATYIEKFGHRTPILEPSAPVAPPSVQLPLLHQLGSVDLDQIAPEVHPRPRDENPTAVPPGQLTGQINAKHSGTDKITLLVGRQTYLLSAPLNISDLLTSPGLPITSSHQFYLNGERLLDLEDSFHPGQTIVAVPIPSLMISEEEVNQIARNVSDRLKEENSADDVIEVVRSQLALRHPDLANLLMNLNQSIPPGTPADIITAKIKAIFPARMPTSGPKLFRFVFGLGLGLGQGGGTGDEALDVSKPNRHLDVPLSSFEGVPNNTAYKLLKTKLGIQRLGDFSQITRSQLRQFLQKKDVDFIEKKLADLGIALKSEGKSVPHVESPSGSSNVVPVVVPTTIRQLDKQEFINLGTAIKSLTTVDILEYVKFIGDFGPLETKKEIEQAFQQVLAHFDDYKVMEDVSTNIITITKLVAMPGSGPHVGYISGSADFGITNSEADSGIKRPLLVTRLQADRENERTIASAEASAKAVQQLTFWARIVNLFRALIAFFSRPWNTYKANQAARGTVFKNLSSAIGIDPGAITGDLTDDTKKVIGSDAEASQKVAQERASLLETATSA